MYVRSTKLEKTSLSFTNGLALNSSVALRLILIKLLSANGDGEIRTLDPLLARQVLSQLSYTPMDAGLPSFEAIPYSFMFCIYFNQPVTSCITLLGNGLKWTRTTDLTLIRRAL